MSIFTYRSKSQTGKTFPIIKSRWDTTKLGSANDTVVLPLTSDGSYNFYVEWGDGTADTITGYNQAEVTHQYSQTGIYDVSIAGDVIGWQFAAIGDDDKILSISRADGLYLNSDRAFYGCSELTSVSSDIHFNDDMKWGFRNCSKLSNGLSNVDVSNVTGMSQLFDSCSLYNEDLSNWDTSNVQTVYRMFYAATAFNSSLANWDVSSCETFDQIFGSTCGYNRLDFTGWNFGTTMRGLLWDADQIDLSSLTTGDWYPTGIQNFYSFARDNSTTGFGFISGWDMSSATDMSYMFYNTDGFLGENLGAWDVSNVTNMSNMFNFCAIGYGGASNLGDWNVSNVTNMNSMFRATEAFNDPSISGWDVSNVTDMSYMFQNTLSFNKDLSPWNVSGVTTMYSMFEGASAFNQDLSSWDFESCDDFRRMLLNSAINHSQVTGWNYGSSARGLLSYLSAVDTSSWTNWHPSRTGIQSYREFAAYNTTFNSSWITGWDMSNAVNLLGMFQNASSFNQPIGVWDISNVTNLRTTFYEADAFNQPLSGWNTSSVTDMVNMFGRHQNYDQDLGSWDTSNVTTMQSMFNRATVFNNGGSSSISGWNTSNVLDFTSFIYNNVSFNQPIGSWDTSSAVNMRDMFYNCTAFNQPLSGWNTSNVTDMGGMFTQTIFDQDIGAWDTSNVTYMAGMFNKGNGSNHNFNNGGSSSISGWNTSKVTSFNYMFWYTNFNQPVGSWDTSSVTDINGTFADCTSFDQDLSNWTVTGVTSAANFMRGIYTAGVTLSTINYDRLLSGWAQQSGDLQAGVSIHFGNSKYSVATGQQYRNILTGVGWTITDGGSV